MVDQDHRSDPAGSDAPRFMQCEVVSNLRRSLHFGAQSGGAPDVARGAETDRAFVRTSRLHSKQVVKRRDTENAARSQLELASDIPEQLGIQMTVYPLRFVQNLNQFVLSEAALLDHGQKPRPQAIGLDGVGHWLLAIVVLASGQ
jgi:hypothetical protein